MGKVTLAVKPGLEKYFTFLFAAKDGQQNLKCLHENCKSKPPRTYSSQQGWSGHIKHLENAHHIVLETLETRSVQTCLSNYLNPKPFSYAKSAKGCYSSSEPQQMSFVEDLLDYITIGGAPLNVVDNWTLIKMIKHLNEKIKIPSRRTVKRKLESSSKTAFAMVKANLAELKEGLHLSTDLWTNRNSSSVMGIRCHYITDSWELVNDTIGFLEFKDRKSGENVRAVFTDHLNSLGIRPSQVGVIMTDNASENIQAFTTLNSQEDDESESCDGRDVEDENESEDDEDNCENNWEDIDGIPDDEVIDADDNPEESEEIFEHITQWAGVNFKRLGCMCHGLQLVINEALAKNPEASKMVKYINSVVSFFSYFSFWNRKLVAIAGVGLVKPGKTRWNGIYLFLERVLRENFILKINSVLDEATRDNKRNKKVKIPEMITPEREVIILELSKLLLPFLKLSDKLQSDNVTSPLVIPGVINLYKSVSNTECTHPYMRAMRFSLALLLTERFGAESQFNYSGRGRKKELYKIFECKEYIMATLLHPAMKFYPFTVPLDEPYNLRKYVPKEDYVKKILKSEVDSLPTEINSPENSSDLTPNKISKNDAIWTFLSHVDTSKGTAIDDPKDEVKKYFYEKLMPIDQCPLEYWKYNAEKFPRLSKLARKYLSFPASSGGVERIFSIAGSIGRARRAKITVKTVSNMLFHRQMRLHHFQKKKK